jgi:hypothetical protein
MNCLAVVIYCAKKKKKRKKKKEFRMTSSDSTLLCDSAPWAKHHQILQHTTENVLDRKNRYCDGYLVGLGKVTTPWNIQTPAKHEHEQGFETIKQLLQQTQPYNFILGVRDTEKTRVAYNDLKFDTSKHSVCVLPLDLLNLKSVQSFAKQALAKLGERPLNYLFLIAGFLASADGPGPHGSQWCESYVVNHLGMWATEEKSPGSWS